MSFVTFNDIIGKEGIFNDGDWVESKDQDPNGTVRLIQLADIGDGIFLNKSKRFLSLETAKRLKCTFLEPNDVLVARMPDPLGRACLFPELQMPCVTVVDVCIIRPDKNIVNEGWLKFLINSTKFRSNIHKYITGSTRQRISRGNLGKLQFHLPPIVDQIRISSILNDIEHLIYRRKESLDLIDTFLKSTFLDMFGDPVINKKKWKIKTIDKLVKKQEHSLKRGPFGGSLKKEIFVQEGYLVYEQYHALNNDFTFKRYFIDENKFNELKAFQVSPGDIIISCSGVYLGKLAIIPQDSEKGVINQALLKITLDGNLIKNDFFVYLFSNESFKQKFYGATIGSGVPNFPPMKDFKKFQFIVPPIELQNKFSKIVEKTEKIKTSLEDGLQELQLLFSSISQNAFNGLLDLSSVKLVYEEQYSVTDNDRVNPSDFEKPIRPESIMVKTKPTNTNGDNNGTISPQSLANQIRNRYRSKHFSFEMLLNFLKKSKMTNGIKYFSSEEIKANNRYDENDDIKVFLETSIINIEMDIKQNENRNPWLKVDQIFYNAIEENIKLDLLKEDFELIKERNAEERSGIYFKILT
jgi:Restriction endonuclease S subunits